MRGSSFKTGSVFTQRSKTSNKLILYTVLFSSLITLVITFAQLYYEYKEDLNAVDKRLENIRLGYRQGITNAVWLDDKKQLTAILDGVNALPNIDYVEVRVDSELYASSGHKVTKNVVSEYFLLQYKYDNKMLIIGETIVEANLSEIYEHLLNRLWVLLASNAIKTFFVAMFMYYLFEKMVFRRLKQVFDFVEDHDVNNLNSRVEVEEVSNHRADEISMLGHSLNKMQEQLSSSLSELLRLKTTLDLSPDGILMCYPGSYKFFYANLGSEKLLGYSKNELINMTPKEICPELNCEVFTRLSDGVDDLVGHDVHFEMSFMHKDGSLIPVKLILQYLNPKDEEPRFVFIARDISKRKADEIMLLKSLEDANAASEAKSKFLMSMSHELRTPLNAVIGFSQLLELDADTFTANQNEAIKDIVQGGKHLLNLIEDIMDLTKIESNNIVLTMEAFDPVSMLKESIKSVASMAVLNEVILENKIMVDHLPEINADKTRFKQAIINLLSNAIKYNDKGGSVFLSYELVNTNVIRFKVTDTGYGIKKSEQVNVFTAFNRLGREASQIEGIGIGLNLTKRLVELMDGEIDFQSTEGTGSEFWIDLKCA